MCGQMIRINLPACAMGGHDVRVDDALQREEIPLQVDVQTDADLLVAGITVQAPSSHWRGAVTYGTVISFTIIVYLLQLAKITIH